METFYSIQEIDSRHQVVLISPKNVELFEENRNDPGNAKIFIILGRHRHIAMIWEEKKLRKLKLFKKMTIFGSKDFMQKQTSRDDTLNENGLQRNYIYP